MSQPRSDGGRKRAKGARPARGRVAGKSGRPERRFWKSLVNFDRLYRPVATTSRLYDGSVLGDRSLIARGTRATEPVVLNEATWLEIRKQTEEIR